MLTSPIKRKIRQFQKVVPKGRCQQMQIIFHSIFLGVGSIISRWRGSEPALRIKERIRETAEIELPWVPEVFLACGGNFRCWPKADTSSAVGRSHEQFARVTIKTWQKPETALEKFLAPRVKSSLLMVVNFSLTLVGFGNVDRVLQPMFTSKQTAEDLNVTEIKPSSVAYRSFNYRFISLQVVSLHMEVVSQ